MRQLGTGLPAALTTAAVLLTGACGVSALGEESILAKDSWVVGVKGDEPGMGKRDAAGRYSGFDVDVAREIARRLGKSVTFTTVTSGQRDDFIADGKVDLVVASYTITPERKTKVAFAGPYYVAHQDILIRDSDGDKIKNVRDLAERRVCGVGGSLSIRRVRNILRERGLTPSEVNASGYSDCLELLRSGRLDAVSTDDLILAGLAVEGRRQGGPPLRLVNAPFSEEPYGVGMNREDVDGCERVNRVITDMYRDGWMEKKLAEWFRGTGLPLSATLPQFEGCDATAPSSSPSSS